jgi:hypothetical protein
MNITPGFNVLQLFSLLLTRWPNKLEQYSTHGWKGLQRTNALAFWPHKYKENDVLLKPFSL